MQIRVVSEELERLLEKGRGLAKRLKEQPLALKHLSDEASRLLDEGPCASSKQRRPGGTVSEQVEIDEQMEAREQAELDELAKGQK